MRVITKLEQDVLLVDGLQGVSLPELESAAKQILDMVYRIGGVKLSIATQSGRELWSIPNFGNASARRLLWERLGGDLNV